MGVLGWNMQYDAFRRIRPHAVYVNVPRTGFVFLLAPVCAQDRAEITISALKKKKPHWNKKNNSMSRWWNVNHSAPAGSFSAGEQRKIERGESKAYIVIFFFLNN